MSNFKIKGVNDDRNFCECCGKDNLKSVVWIENLETGELKHFGSTCALSPLKAFGIKPKDIAKEQKIYRWKKEEAYRNSPEVKAKDKLAAAIREKTAEKYLSTGNKFYAHGAYNAVNRQLYNQIFESVTQELTA